RSGRYRRRSRANLTRRRVVESGFSRAGRVDRATATSSPTIPPPPWALLDVVALRRSIGALRCGIGGAASATGTAATAATATSAPIATSAGPPSLGTTQVLESLGVEALPRALRFRQFAGRPRWDAEVLEEPFATGVGLGRLGER